MSYERIDRISEEVRREVDKIIRDELHDPRITGTFSITRCDVTRDLRYAKVYVSILEDDRRDGMMAALKSAAGYIRRSLGRNMLIRYSPELSFVCDRNIEYGVHIAKVLSDAMSKEGAVENEGSETDA